MQDSHWADVHGLEQLLKTRLSSSLVFRQIILLMWPTMNASGAGESEELETGWRQEATIFDGSAHSSLFKLTMKSHPEPPGLEFERSTMCVHCCGETVGFWSAAGG